MPLIRDAGIMPTGVSSPWGFGREAEEEYRAAIATAMKEELGLDRGWYFSVRSGPNPDISEPIKGFRLAAVKHNVGDMVWQGINSPRDDVEFINKIADDYITEDGKSGKAAERILSGEPAIMLIHWQSLYSNGTRSGLRAFEKIAERINRC